MMPLPARHLLLSAVAALFFAATLAGNWTSVRDAAIRAARDWTGGIAEMVSTRTHIENWLKRMFSGVSACTISSVHRIIC